ncbi:MAG TPA: carboxypeptidase-like regulatory domain-containing protein, partial [Edaphobacter sp.]|nr:carboxypeptidase-like regulatory domain-containing protein [Edaphobacter sp.]
MQNTPQRCVRRLPRIVLTLLTMILAPASVFAQLSSAAVNGAVKDNTGASVPRAIVVLQNTATSVERTTLTNDGGNYSFPSVAPGRYRVRISAPSFQTEQISAFDVGVDQVVALNSTLRAGDVKVAVEVEAEGVQIE